MTTALAIVTTVIDKKLVEKVERQRRGPKGHGMLCILRLLVYAILMQHFSSRKLDKHLRKRCQVWQRLGFKSRPSFVSITRWRKRYQREFEECIALLGDAYIVQRGSVWTLLDSTPLEDEADHDARVGHCSKGEFKGFKLHMSCDEDRVPLRATFTTGNVHDSVMGEHLLAPTPLTGGDAGYDAEALKNTIRNAKSIPIFVHNPRRAGKAAKLPTWPPLKQVRVCIEQCNSIVKTQVLQNAWQNVKGFFAKATFALAGVLALQALAIFNLTTRGYPTLKVSEVRI
jgi:hypothetical protein